MEQFTGLATFPVDVPGRYPWRGGLARKDQAERKDRKQFRRIPTSIHPSVHSSFYVYPSILYPSFHPFNPESANLSRLPSNPQYFFFLLHMFIHSFLLTIYPLILRIAQWLRGPNVEIRSLDSRPMLFMAYLTLKKFLNLSRLHFPLVNWGCLLKAKESDWKILIIFMFLQICCVCFGENGAKEGKTSK